MANVESHFCSHWNLSLPQQGSLVGWLAGSHLAANQKVADKEALASSSATTMTIDEGRFGEQKVDEPQPVGSSAESQAGSR